MTRLITGLVNQSRSNILIVYLKIGTVPTYTCILVRVIVLGNIVVKRLLSLDWLTKLIKNKNIMPCT